jgi:hypothetical protein
VEIDILEIKEGIYIFLKGHVDGIPRIAIPWINQGDVIACEETQSRSRSIQGE